MTPAQTTSSRPFAQPIIPIVLAGGLAIFGFLVAGAYAAILWAVVRFSIRPFRTPLYLSPGAMGTPHQEVRIPARANTTEPEIPAWWIEGDHDWVALHLHGYLMNRSELVPTAVWLRQHGIGSLLIDFSAHGWSRGKTTSLGYHEKQEVHRALAWIRQRQPNAHIVIIGSSMGSAAGALALGEDPAAAEAIVMDSAYSEMHRAIAGWWSLFVGPTWQRLLGPVPWVAGWMLRINVFRVDVAEALSRTSAKVLILHGQRDRLTPPYHAERNAAAAGDRGELVWFEHSAHSEGRWIDPDRYFSALARLLDLPDRSES